MSAPAAAAGRVLAPLGRRRCAVVRRSQLGAYFVLSLADAAGPTPQAGQFYMLSAAERWGGGEDERPFLPRAFSVARSHEDGTLDFVLEDVGPGTNRLAELAAGDGVWLLGPLGAGFAAPRENRRPILCGGGIGVAPLAIWQETLRVPPQRDDVPDAASIGGRTGSDATALLGFRSAAHAAGAGLLQGARVATDDGSTGHHGLVTDLLRDELGRDPHAEVYACGPPLMLEAVRALCAELGVPGQLALESGMACGFGACFGCVVPTRAGFVRLCIDGPVLDAAELEAVHAH